MLAGDRGCFLPDRQPFFILGETDSFFVAMETTTQLDCATACQGGCRQPDNCLSQAHLESAANFIGETSIDQMHEIAEAARRKKMMAPPQWVIPEWLDEK
jgi:hypothetical protein